MKRRIMLLGIMALVTLSTSLAKATPPLYEPRVVPGAGTILPPTACTPENAFEQGKPDGLSQRWTNAFPYNQCQRLKIVFGPIWAKPGQNDVLIQPVTFEKPLYPGYLVRFKPDLVNQDGVSPRVKDLHLHHGTWLNPGYLGVSVPGGTDPGRPYGWGPWIASGEEKTIAVWPTGFGLNVLPSDQWLFLHMIHNATPQTFPVWVTYELDFIPAAAAETINPATGAPYIQNTKGIWLDVGDCHSDSNAAYNSACKKDSFNPIFNIQRGYGTSGACGFPDQDCAQQNTLANKSAQQGVDLGTVHDDWKVPQSGTIVMMGGHLHFGGLADRVSLVRDLNHDGVITPDEVKLIFDSDAYYWDTNFDPTKWQPQDAFDVSKNVVGGQPTSWDMVMTGNSRDLGWSIKVQKGDMLRIEGVYDSTTASWYEQMGIVMAWLAPEGVSGIDPFASGITMGEGLNTRALNPPTAPGYQLPGANLPDCTPSDTNICARGSATHARIPTSGDHWTCEVNGCPDVAGTAPDGQVTTDIHMGGFTYGEADFGVIPTLGIPRVKVNTPVTFTNVDTADYMWHTVTRCVNPCSGTTSASYPVPNGAWADEVDWSQAPADPVARYVWSEQQTTSLVAANGPDPLDFDSGQIGNAENADSHFYTSWSWTPTRTGIYTFFCRIHPSMRGAVKVIA